MFEKESIQKLRELNEDQLSIYEAGLCSNHIGDVTHNRYIIAELTNKALTYPVTVAPQIVYNYFLHYLSSIYSNLIWSFVGETPYSDELYPVYFMDSDEEDYHYIFLTKEQKEDLISKASLIEAGYEAIEPLESLESTLKGIITPARIYIKWYLYHLGLRQKDDETPEEYAGIMPEQIPTNSPVLDIDSQSARFSSAIWADKMKGIEVTVAGIGGIGSWVVLLLSRMQVKRIVMYDDDYVEAVNMAGQLYNRQDIGRAKVEAMASTIHNYSNYDSVYCFRKKLDYTQPISKVLLCGFDNMVARMTAFNKWKDSIKDDEDKSKYLFIDGRLAAESFQVFCIRGDDEYSKSRYAEKYLFSDEEADETICSYKQTTYMANMIAGVMVNLFTNFVANSIVKNIRDLPFFTEYEGDSLTLKIKEV